MNPQRTSPYKLPGMPVLKHGPHMTSEMLMKVHQENARKLSKPSNAPRWPSSGDSPSTEKFASTQKRRQAAPNTLLHLKKQRVLPKRLPLSIDLGDDGSPGSARSQTKRTGRMSTFGSEMGPTD